MVHAAESAKAINCGSFGARPGRSSIDPALITLLQTELSHLTRTSLIVCPNDAAQCYDRIVPNHALVSCISHGLASSAAACKPPFRNHRAVNSSSEHSKELPARPRLQVKVRVCHQTVGSASRPAVAGRGGYGCNSSVRPS